MGSSRCRGISRIFTLMILLLPILSQIDILGYSVLEFFSIAMVCVLLVRSDGKLKAEPFVLPYAYMAVSTFFAGCVFGDSPVTILLSAARVLVIYFGIFSACREYFNYEYARKWLIRFALIISGIIVLQSALYYVFKIQFYPIPGNIKLNYRQGMNSTNLVAQWVRSVRGGYFFRPCAMFMEPAHAAYYLVLATTVLLFRKENSSKCDLYYALLTSAAAILTTSTIGIVLSIAVWAGFVFFGKNNLKRNHKLSILVVLMIVLGAFAALILTEGIQRSLLRKLSQFQNMSQESSTYLRLFRGFDFYRNMGPVEMLFGCGYAHSAEYYETVKLVNVLHYADSNFMNSISRILCSTGIIGLALFMFAIIVNARRNGGCSREVAILLVILMCVGAIMDIGMFYLYMCFIISRKTRNSLRRKRM